MNGVLFLSLSNDKKTTTKWWWNAHFLQAHSFEHTYTPPNHPPCDVSQYQSMFFISIQHLSSFWQLSRSFSLSVYVDREIGVVSLHHIKKTRYIRTFRSLAEHATLKLYFGRLKFYWSEVNIYIDEEKVHCSPRYFFLEKLIIDNTWNCCCFFFFHVLIYRRIWKLSGRWWW